MRTVDVIEHFKTQQGVADALGMSQSSVGEWKEYPPPARQMQIEQVTRGVLKAEPFDRLFKRKKTEPEENGA